MKPGISITTIPGQEEGWAAVLALTEQYCQDIRRRAFDHFQRRGEILGNDWDDWLLAERELSWMPRAEMFENTHSIVLRVAVPGFGPRSLGVTATPNSLLIQGTEEHHHTGLDARLRFCEFGTRLFRRFDLPTAIDPNGVSATLDKGILEILARVARRPKDAPGVKVASCAAA